MIQISRAARRRRQPADDGFSVIEALVAMVILGISATVSATLLINVLDLTTNTNKRITASSIASTEMERVRQLAATKIEPGFKKEVVGNTEYTMTREASYLPSDGSASACTGTGKLAYKKVAVSVTWPNMGTTKPVRSETLRALGFNTSTGGLDAAKGSLAVLVSDSNGKPVPGVTVVTREGSATGTPQPAQVTDSEGCAVFVGLTAGKSYYSSGTKVGHVNKLGLTTASDIGASITANTLSKVGLELAPSGTLNIEYTAPAGGTIPPAKYPLTLTSSVWNPTSRTVNPGTAVTAGGAFYSATGTQVSPLFPANYAASLCGAPIISYAAVTPGGTATATAQLGTLKVKTTGGGTSVTATNPACPSSSAVSTPASLTESAIALPAGTWTLKTTSGKISTVTIVAGAASSATVIP